MDYYCVGFHWYGQDRVNNLERFVKEGIWENGYEDKFTRTVKNVPVGSRLAAKTTYTKKDQGKTISVLKVHALGTVKENGADGISLKVEWDPVFEPFELEGKGAYRSTINRVKNKQNIDLIFHQAQPPDGDALIIDEEHLQHEFPLNQILYGPPGTGKTYNSISKAVAIIDGIKEEHLKEYYDDREGIQERYEELVREGKIDFITFHQSLSYEDFIEGIKPVSPDVREKQLSYEIQDGLFKRISNRAMYSLLDRNETGDQIETSSFDKVYQDYLDYLRPSVGNEEGVFSSLHGYELLLLEIKGTSVITRFKWYNREKQIEAKQPFSVTKEKIKTLYENGLDPNKVESLKESFKPFFKHNLSVYYAVYKSFFNYVSQSGQDKTIEVIDQEDYQYEEIVDAWGVTEHKRKRLENADRFVLIIDEINRGNVSQIFGELITLVEEQKRFGQSHTIEATLPYSKKKFAVAPNLHLVGTMNTADRSVEALDVALRRRFVFEHLGPEYELPGLEHVIGESGKRLKNLLLTINERVTFLKDEDHQIGHSYLMNKTNEEQLVNTFKRNILPLMKEYFYNDYEKIRWVLGDGFVEEKEADDAPKMAVTEVDSLMPKTTYQIRSITTSTILDQIKLLFSEQ